MRGERPSVDSARARELGEGVLQSSEIGQLQMQRGKFALREGSRLGTAGSGQ